MFEISDEELYRHLGKKLKQLREDSGIKQNDIAEAVNLLRTSISNIESGRQHPPLNLIYRMCSVLGVEVTAILPKMEDVRKQNEVDVQTTHGVKKMPPQAAELLKKMIG